MRTQPPDEFQVHPARARKHSVAATTKIMKFVKHEQDLLLYGFILPRKARTCNIFVRKTKKFLGRIILLQLQRPVVK